MELNLKKKIINAWFHKDVELDDILHWCKNKDYDYSILRHEYIEEACKTKADAIKFFGNDIKKMRIIIEEL
jgi:hypothetical protein